MGAEFCLHFAGKWFNMKFIESSGHSFRGGRIKMKVILNGQEKAFSSSLNLSNLVEQFCRETRYIIAEVNGEIIRHPCWEKTSIQEGDTIELVNFVGGG